MHNEISKGDASMRRRNKEKFGLGCRRAFIFSLSCNTERTHPVFLFLLAVLLFLPTQAAAQKNFSTYKEKERQSAAEFMRQRNEAFAKYRRKIRRAFSEYRAKAVSVWGEAQAAVPNRQEWVTYRNEMRERRRVNFKEGQAAYEIIFKPGEEEIPDTVKSRLTALIVDSVVKGPDQRSIEEVAANPSDAEPGGEPLLQGLFRTESGKTVTRDNVRGFARKKVQNRLGKSKVEGKDGKQRVVASVNVPMIPEHLRKLAKRYEGIVKDQAERRSLSPELVFAIIETESYFNPQARSPVPAFGLMQLVPVTGGQEAYRIVYGKNEQPSEELLYKPDANVTLGSAYFHRLYYTYMEGIENDRSRLWCAVASYNTGPSNLYDTFSEKGKAAAINRINSMSSEEVFDHLIDNLPYKETRKYVQKVKKKMPKYKRM